MMALAVILSLCLASFMFPISAASAPEIVHDGLVAWYDGTNNSNGEQNYDATVWMDPGAKVYVDEIALFSHEDAALIYAGELKEETEAPTDPVTEASTEQPVEAPTELPAEDPTDDPADEPADRETTTHAGESNATDAPDGTDGGDQGCASVVAMGAAVVLSANAVAVALKKKD